MTPEQIAAALIAERIDEVRRAVSDIDAMDRMYPRAPVGMAWQSLRATTDRLYAILNQKDRENAA